MKMNLFRFGVSVKQNFKNCFKWLHANNQP